MKSDFDAETSITSTSGLKLEADEPMENICLPLLRKKNPKLKYLNPKMRNAGRKKSNPAWEYFEDLRPGGILQGVRCRHCDFYSEDRSPTMMKYHIKRKHDTGPGGLWEMLNACYDRLGSHKYIPKKRAKIISPAINGLNDESDLYWDEEGNFAEISNAKDSELNDVSDGPSSVQSLSMCEGIDADGSVADCPTTSQSFTIDESNDHTVTDASYSAEMEKLATDILQLTAVQDSSSYKSSLPKVEMWDRAMDLSQKTRPRNANNWTYLATFDNEDEMHQVRIREKVSKRREEMLKNGRKVRYRCNKWKSTKCGFQMFALFANDKIDLYETGVHDHTGERVRRHIEKMFNKGVIVAPPGPRQPSQSQILRRLLKQSVNQKRHQVITITAYNGETDAASNNADCTTNDSSKKIDCSTVNTTSDDIPTTSSGQIIDMNVNNTNTADETLPASTKRARKLTLPSKMGHPPTKVPRKLTTDSTEKGETNEGESAMSSDETDFDHVLQGMGWISENKMKDDSLSAEMREQNSSCENSSDSEDNTTVGAPELSVNRQQQMVEEMKLRQINNKRNQENSNNRKINQQQKKRAKNEEDTIGQLLQPLQNGLPPGFNAESFASFCAAIAVAESSKSDFATTNFNEIAAAAAAMTMPSLKNGSVGLLQERVTDYTPPHKSTPTQMSSSNTAFSLADMMRISELVEIASDLELDLKLCPPGSGTIIEYIFCPKEASSGRSVSISEDLAQTDTRDQMVVVRDLVNGSTVREETWSKTSWSLFHWAIRGKCSHFFADKKRKK